MKKIRTFIVDDSAVVRSVLTKILEKDPMIEVIGSAIDPIFAMKKLENETPDVIILDIEMPRMNGLTYLKKIMSENPTPVVICSTLTKQGANETIQAMSYGAIEIIRKPEVGLKDFLTESEENLIRAVKAASVSKVHRIPSPIPKANVVKTTSSSFTPSNLYSTTEKVIAIGSSTGGTIALESILTKLDKTCYGIIIVQHMPEGFTKAFANRLDQICEINVKEAEDGDRVLRGHALLAAGNRHLELKLSGARYHVAVKPGPKVNHHCPSVDIMYRSVAKTAGKNAMGILLTGMGDDGAAGMLEMKKVGAYNIAQDKDSSIVFGMPKAAIDRNAQTVIESLDNIPTSIQKYSQ